MNNSSDDSHIFLGRSELDETVNLTDAIFEANQSVPFDNERLKSFVTSPGEVDENTLYQIADIFDKKTHMNDEDLIVNQESGQNTVDRILDAVALIYIEENGIPVAASLLVDPTKENFKGIIPSDYYEMKSGVSIENRMKQEYFEVLPDKKKLGLASELRRQIQEISPYTFIVVPENDTDTTDGLSKNGYTKTSTFKVDGESVPVELWLNYN